MAEYIDREKLIRYAEKQEVIIKDGTSIADAMRIQGNVFRRCVETAPAADVVPSAEVERLQHILDCYALQYGTVKDQQSAIDKAKAEVEKEIGEEIHRIIGECHNETWVCLLIKEFADRLTKKDESQN